MGWPQYVYIALTMIGVLILASAIDKPRKKQVYTAGDFVTNLVSSAIIYGLLYAGGFFG